MIKIKQILCKQFSVNFMIYSFETMLKLQDKYNIFFGNVRSNNFDDMPIWFTSKKKLELLSVYLKTWFCIKTYYDKKLI